MVRIQNIEAILDKLPRLKPVPALTTKRNLRTFKMEEVDSHAPKRLHHEISFKKQMKFEPLVNESAIKQVCQIQKAHKDSVRSV